MNEKIVYFSLNPKRKESFYNYVKKEGICYRQKFSFSLEAEKEVFQDPRDLITIIEHTPNKDSLHIIIDYVSCCGTQKEINFSTVLRDVIMCYPEVQFLFDETFVKKAKKPYPESPDYNFKNFLFWEAGSASAMKTVLDEFHQFNLGDFSKDVVDQQFIRLLKGCNNMYDGSNLRYAIKKYKFDMLSVVDNYENLQKSRSQNAAIVVDEEYHQSMFNSYCLYANGFRVIPIVTATELLWINKEEHKAKFPLEPLAFRDYDLQFVDENKVQSGVKTKKDSNKNRSRNEIDFIRGAKRQYKEDKNGELTDKVEKYILLLPKDEDDKDNPYWKAFADENIFFVSKGDDHLGIGLGYKQAMNAKRRRLKLRGLKKPLEGIYIWGHKIKIVKECYKGSRDKAPFKMSRKDSDGHSCPLDIYGIARSMVHRAEVYYQSERYRLAALVASESLEVLNGFHKSLMSRAYYIKAVSENAMAMSLLGGDERRLSEDVRFRMKKVKRDVVRMVTDKEDQKNTLYNIYNDCRLFCREKEYFDAADHALSFMMYEKEGWNWYRIGKFIKKILNC